MTSTKGPGSARTLHPSDSFCPKCGHNRDTSSVSSIDHGDGMKSCQFCGATWREGPNAAMPELPELEALLALIDEYAELPYFGADSEAIKLRAAIADQMRSFYAAGVKAGMERAAQVAGGLDCALICGVGHEVAAVIRKESSNG